MRLWSISLKYLDSKGLVALWREGLLAQNVLRGQTKGYKNHPQLNRFKTSEDPILAISTYLKYVLKEADKRNYNFNKNKIYKKESKKIIKIKVTTGQLEYEFNHLLNKLKKRDPNLYKKIKDIKKIPSHPLFKIVKGDIEDWEII